MPLRLVEDNEYFRLLQDGNLGVMHFLRPWPATHASRTIAHLEAVAKVSPGNTGFVVILASDVGPPPSEARPMLLEKLKEHARTLQAFACVIQGKGLRDIASRAFMTAVGIAARPTRIGVFSEADPAFSWLEAKLGRSTFYCSREFAEIVARANMKRSG